MSFVYSCLLFLAILFYFPIYFFRIRIIKKEKVYLRQRLGHGLPARIPPEESIWIHAVSVGEVLSLQNLIKELKRRHPSWEINFSALTNSGLRVAKEKLKDADNIFFIPLDFAHVVRRVFKALKPGVLILAESEFWPNLLREAHKQTKGVLLINGRVSEHSFRKYIQLKPLARGILKYIDRFLVQTDKDKDKILKIGIDPARVEVAGNLKSEVSLPQFSPQEISLLKKRLSIPEGKKVIVAGSTRKGEEDQIFQAFAQARDVRQDLVLVLAPRHPERANEVEKICQNYPLRIERRSQLSPEKHWDVLILDTMGELAQVYALSDLAFVGGSLVRWGGHNLLEPAFYRKPILFGPHMENFATLAEKFVRHDAARIVKKQQDLAEAFLFKQEKELREMGGRAKELLNSLQGATEKTIKAIEDLMAKNSPD